LIRFSFPSHAWTPTPDARLCWLTIVTSSDGTGNFTSPLTGNAGRIVLNRLDLKVAERIKPIIASSQVITNIDPYQSQLINRFRRGSLLVPGETLLVLEVAPAAYINFAANEAEKGSSIKLNHISSVGRFGRMWLSGSEAEIIQARDAATSALEALEGVEGR